MKIYTNENNTSTLKLLIAANLAGKKVQLIGANLADGIFTGPRQLPYLEVDEELTFFSSNAATQYLFPILDMSEDGQCQQMQEWEATRLHPLVQTAISSKTVSADVRQLLTTLTRELDGILSKSQYILGDKISSADISIWSTLYPLYYNEDHKAVYLKSEVHLQKWIEELAAASAFKDALKQWGGSAKGPFTPESALGIPRVANATITSTEEAADVKKITDEEIEYAATHWETGYEKLRPPLEPQKVVLPRSDRKNVLITSSLPYVNNVPHLGNIIGCVLSADIFARYCRMAGYNTLYISGTDEYGTATENKAIEEKCTPREICDKYYQIHNDVYRWFNIGFDYFGRSSTPEQTVVTQHIFNKLRENGFISTQSVEQLKCKKCDRFLADRFVEGTCPHPGCGYEGARGDQCDKCGKLVNATDLVAPRCKQCGDSPHLEKSEQLFLELTQLEPSVRSWVMKHEEGWSPASRAVARAWLKEGLRARCITRDLKWGVPVPLSGYEDKVFYVWFDAPIGYISITQCCTKEYKKWWTPDPGHEVKLYQFMAKDNVPFHSVMFPAMLIGANEGYVLVEHLFATEYLNYEEGKFSKSRGVGVFGTDAQDTGIPSDVWRFYLASVRPESSDSSFSWAELGLRNNSELLNNLGNFCHRSLSFCYNSYGGVVPAMKLEKEHYELMAYINREVIAYAQHMEKGRLRESLKTVMAVSRLGNQHMQAEQPWVLLKGSDDDKIRAETVIALCCHIVGLLCALISPYMPDTALNLCKQLNLDRSHLRILPESPSIVQYLPQRHKINKPEPLFTKIEPERLELLRAKYAGTQTDRANKENSASIVFKNTDVAELEEAIAKQGEVVRQLKASTKDKGVWQPHLAVLLDLKKQLAAVTAATPAGADTVQDLEKAIAEQGDKVRKLKATTKDKSVWSLEVNTLLDLKKKLAALQVTNK